MLVYLLTSGQHDKQQLIFNNGNNNNMNNSFHIYRSLTLSSIKEYLFNYTTVEQQQPQQLQLLLNLIQHLLLQT